MLSIKNLVKIYTPKHGASVEALKGINLDFADKGLVFMLGKSGSGKSTMLNLIGGLDAATSGEIIIKGRSSASFTQSDYDSYRNTYIGFIFQEFNILQDYSVGENIGLALELQHKKATGEAISNILAEVDLEGFENRNPNELSGGQKQRIAIARALIKEPEIIMADEPTGSLDSKTGKQVFETLRKLAKKTLVIVVSHDRESAETYGDRIIELADGLVISDKVRVQSGEQSKEPIRFVDNLSAEIDAGYQLKQQDVEVLNEFLLKAEKTVTLNAKLSPKSSRYGELVDRTEQNYPVKKYERDDCRLVKSRLPAKDCLRMGTAGLRLKKVRLAFTIFLSFLAFSLFGFSLVAYSYSALETNLKTMHKKGIESVFVSSIGGSIANGYQNPTNYDGKGFTLSQLNDIEQLSGKRPIPVISTTANFSHQLVNTRKQSYHSLYYAKAIRSFIEIKDGIDEDYLSLTPANTAQESRLPSAKNEIAITDYIADSFLEFGLRDLEKTTSTSIKAYSITNYGDLLGCGIKLMLGAKDRIFTITGVFETQIDKSEYYPYRDIEGYKGSITLDIDGLNKSIITTAFLAQDYLEYVNGWTWYTPSYNSYRSQLTLNGEQSTAEDAEAQGRYSYLWDELMAKKTLIDDGLGGSVIIELAKTDVNLSGVFWLREGELKLADDEIALGTYTLFKLKCFNAQIHYSAFENLSLYCYENDVSLAQFLEYSENKSPSFAHQSFYNANQELFEGLGALIGSEVQYSYKGIEKTFKLAGVVTDQRRPDVVLMSDNSFSPVNRLVQELDPLIGNSYGIGKFPQGKELDTSDISLLYYIDQHQVEGIIPTSIVWQAGREQVLKDNEVLLPYLSLYIGEKDKYYDSTLEQIQQRAREYLSGGAIEAQFGRRYIKTVAGKEYDFVLDGVSVKIVGFHSMSVGTIAAKDFVDQAKLVSKLPNDLLIILTNNVRQNRKIFNYVNALSETLSDDAGAYFMAKTTINTVIAPLLSTFEEQINQFKDIFLYISLGFSVFAGLLLMNFIGVSIEHKKRDIGILRAIGARSKDIFSIFMCESALVGTINIILSAIMISVACAVINNLTKIVLLIPLFTHFFAAAALCYIVAALATLLPVKKISSKKPVDAINNK